MPLAVGHKGDLRAARAARAALHGRLGARIGAPDAPAGLATTSSTCGSAAIRAVNSAPAVSSPITAPSRATPPRAAILRATLPTPPGIATVRLDARYPDIFQKVRDHV